MKRYAYFPGCSLDGTAIAYKRSIEFVAERIGLELREIPGWNCCGATCAHSKSNMLGLALPARNLAIAERETPGLDIAVPCASCYSRMKHTAHSARADDDIRKKLETIIEMPYAASADVLSLPEILTEPEALEACKNAMRRSLGGLKAACYYGCLMVRPRAVTGSGDTEDPMQLDEIISLTGAEPVRWEFKTECCGASHQVDAPGAARPLIERIFANAKTNGAEAIVTACPLCNLNLDMREEDINRRRGTAFDMPVYQFTQLLAICMGATAGEAGIHKHFYPAYGRINDALRRAGG